MLRMQHISHIQSLLRLSTRHLARHQIQKVRRLTQVLPHRRQIQALTRPMEIRRDDPNLGHQLDRRRPLLIHIQVMPTRVVTPQHAHRRPHHIDRLRLLRCRLQKLNHSLRKLPLSPQGRRQLLQLRPVRQGLMKQQIHHFLIAHFASQLIDVIAAVIQQPLLTFDLP